METNKNQTVKVIYRLEKWDDGSYYPIAFFPECRVNYGRIMCYSFYEGCHSEAALEYYWDTKPMKDNMEAGLNDYLTRLYSEDEPKIILKPMQRLNMNDLRLLAWGIY